MEGNYYATVKCTYTELRTADGQKVFTVTSKSCRDMGGCIPFVAEVKELTEQEKRAMDAWERGEFNQYSDGSYWYDGMNYTLDGIREMGKCKIYLTSKGFDLLASKVGYNQAWRISGMDLYARRGTIDIKANIPVEEDPGSEPLPDPEPEKKEGNKLFNTLLLLIAGILTMR